MTPRSPFVATLLIAALACREAPPTDAPDAPVPGKDLQLRRLSNAELDHVLDDLIGPHVHTAATSLPADPLQPFDNDVRYQDASALWVESIDRLAEQVAGEVVSDPVRLSALLGCSVSPPPADGGRGCLQAWLGPFLRRALRREVRADEVRDFLALGLADLDAGAGLGTATATLLRATLQDPELLYRTEAVRPDDPTRLDDTTLASRMSFLLWGTGPDDALLDAARDGRLADPDGRRAQAVRMLNDRRAVPQAQRIHAMWLNYLNLSDDPAIVPLIHFEVDSIVERVLFTEQRPWSDLLTFPELPLFETTAMIYGVPWVKGEAHRWMDLTSMGRGGILSTMAFFSGSSRTTDTSPTLRGKLILERLLCEPPPPPPPTVMADVPPPLGLAECKIDRYVQHRVDPACRSCHERMDNIGIGLERYDKIGAYRTHDYYPFIWDINPNCPIPDGADVPGIGTFRTPLELATLLRDTGKVPGCFVEHLVEYTFGGVGGVDEAALVSDLTARFLAGGERYGQLMVELVASDAFAARGEE